MSLIQEALRRQQEEMDDNSGAPSSQPAAPAPTPRSGPTISRKIPLSSAPAPETDSSAPPPVQQPPQLDDDDVPPPPPPEAMEEGENSGEAMPAIPAKDGKAGLKVALLVTAAVLCLGLGVWAVTFAIQKLRTPPAPQEPTSSGQPQSVEPVPADPTLPEPTPVTPTTQPVAVKPPVVEAPPEPEVIVEPIIWPILSISGLVGKGEQGSVMFGAEIVGVGESIEGVKVLSISKQGAQLEYRGEKKFVKVGGTTE